MQHTIVVTVTGDTDLNAIAKAIDYRLASDDVNLPDWSIKVDGESWVDPEDEPAAINNNANRHIPECPSCGARPAQVHLPDCEVDA